MNKKIALLVIRKNYREIDWIIPLIYKIKDNFKIITFFQDKNILKKFSKENISLYNKWRKINSFHFFPTTKHIFLSRLLTLFSFGNFFLTKLINNYIRKEFYSEKYLDQLLLKKNLKDHKLEIIFHEISKNTSWINSFIKNNNVKIVRFPDSTVPRGNYKLDKIKRNKISFIKNLFILASSKHDLSEYIKSYNEKNIKVIGYPRYSNEWLRHFLQEKKFSKKKIFLVGCKQYKKRQKYNIEKQIYSIMKSTSLIKNSITIFKPHPAQNINELKSILSNFDMNLWQITNEHILKYKNSAELFIGFHRSSSVLDAIASNIPTIKLWSWKANDKNDTNEQNYIKRYGIHKSILTELNLTKLVLNQSELQKMILSNKKVKVKLLNKQKLNFKKLISHNKTMEKVLSKILNDR